MQVELSKDKKSLIVTIPLQAPTRSASGKTLVVASTRGNTKTPLLIDGQPVTVGLNAYIANTAQTAAVAVV